MDGMNFSEGIGSADGGAEITQEDIEQFKERARKTAAQAKKDKKTEGKRKDEEAVLVDVILQFLKNKKYAQFFLLLSRLLQKNVPSYFILAVLALIHKESASILDAKNIVIKKAPPQTTNFPPEISRPLSSWNTLIFSVASAQPHRVLETVLDQDWNIDPNLVQFFSLVLQEFFVFKKFETPTGNIYSFSQTFLQGLTLSLEKQIQGQDKISG